MRTFVKHFIKWEYGWGSQLRDLDVMKIGSIIYHKRLFKLTQRDLPYTLAIEYDEPHEVISIGPTFSGSGGATLYNKTELTQTITFRLPSEKYCIDEINTIYGKQNGVEKMILNLVNDYYEKDHRTDDFK